MQPFRSFVCSARTLAVAGILLFTFAWLGAPSGLALQATAASSSKYVVCWSANLNAGTHTDSGMIPDKKYYSSIFEAQPSQQGAVQNAYTRYLLRAYPNDNTGPGVCRFYDTQGAAQAWLDTAKRDDSSNNRQVYDTGWSYN
jgi:hypothetical protein